MNIKTKYLSRSENMLFDERDLSVFDNVDSRSYFKEILQLYYSQNYRATIVMLYSFVIYDLYIKLQTMANEGDKKAINKLTEINDMIADDEKYSKVEKEIILFFKVNCPLYFDRFIEDIEYLKNCRNKCAHLKVNDNTLFVPSDYHARMLICSMYDNILAVKAPFIMDLFSIAKLDVENYAKSISYISNDGLDENIKNTLKNKYLIRMTYDSLKKSYKTFIRLLFVSEDEDCINNAYGLYAFAYTMTDYLIKNGYIQIFSEAVILNTFSNIKVEQLKSSNVRRNAFISIITTYPVVMDIIRSNVEVFEYVTKCVVLKPQGLCYYRSFYPRSKKSIYTFFKENAELHQPTYSTTLYNVFKESEDFNFADFMLVMVKAVPSFNGFHDADSFMSFFKSHLEELTIDEIKNVMKIYRSNGQCTNRARHSSDVIEIKSYIDEHTPMTDSEAKEKSNIEEKSE